MTPDFREGETTALLRELDQIIDGDRYPFSPRIRDPDRDSGQIAAGS
jgi:hypothetical protein